MLARALVVLLLILNLGVALWWAARGEPAPPDEVVLPEDVERLRLLEEPPLPARAPLATNAPAAEAASVPDDDADAVVDQAAPAATQAVPAAAIACHAFGPFADAATAGRASATLRPSVQRLATRESRTAPRGWRVFLPALPDREAAGAAAQRLAAAGFSDHYLLPAADGGTVEIALGRFGGEAAAQRHRAALRAAGFEAAAEPIGDGGATRYWIDVAAGEEVDLDALRRASGAAQAEGIDCGTIAAR